jgi:hypothetical protein
MPHTENCEFSPHTWSVVSSDALSTRLPVCRTNRQPFGDVQSSNEQNLYSAGKDICLMIRTFATLT